MIGEVVFDEVVSIVIACCMFVLFATAGIHKLNDRQTFLATLNDYRLVPPSITPMLSFIVPILEACLALFWIFQLLQPLTAIISASLLSIYTLAIAINLARGLTHIDCGCNFSAVGETGSLISPALLLRNSLLILAILGTLLPTAPRELVWLDYATIVVTTLVAVIFYISTSQLLANKTAIATWRY